MHLGFDFEAPSLTAPAHPKAQFVDIDEADYHARTGVGPHQRVSRSMLHTYAQSPRGFYLRYVQKHPLAQFGGSSSTDFGSLFDQYLTEPHRLVDWPEEYLTKSGSVSTSKAAQAWRAAQEEVGLTVVAEKQRALCDLILNEMVSTGSMGDFTHDLAQSQIQSQITTSTRLAQPCIQYTDQGVPLQVRLDKLFDEAAIDIKTTSDDLSVNGASSFLSSAFKYGYHLQAYMYARALELATGRKRPFLFAVFQTTYPFSQALIQLPEFAMGIAEKVYHESLASLGHDLREGFSAPLSSENPKAPLVITPQTPGWLLRQEEDYYLYGH